MPQITLTVADGNDDTGFYDGGGGECYRTSATARLGFYAFGAVENLGFRFANMPLIGARHKVVRARLRLKAAASTTQTLDADIGCEDVDNAGNFVAQCNPASHVMTTAYATQTSTTTVDGEWFYSVDFAAAVQEVIDRPGWAIGNALSVLCVQQSPTGGQISVKMYESGDVPQLVIDYAYRGFAGSST